MPFFTPPTQGRIGRLDWAWDSVPEGENLVSGDALFIERDRSDGSVMFLLVDVMGHGEKAAYVVERFRRSYLWDDYTQDQQPRDLLEALHSLIAPHWAGETGQDAILIERGRRAAETRHSTALALLVDPVSGRCAVSVAAVPEPYHLVARDGAVRTYGLTGSGLGFPDDVPAAFGVTVFTLAPADRIVAMTDGVTEAIREPLIQDGARATLFQGARLPRSLAFLPRYARLSAQVARLFEAVQAFAGTDWPRDDATVLLLALDPEGEPP